jgi:hypothetical protein
MSSKSTVFRRGQTLAEFALTLPILLLLVFGTIEFGRVFQSWVTLQNAARSAARYTSIGAINYELFDVPTGSAPLDERVLNTIVPCIGTEDAGGSDQRGTIGEINGVNVLQGGAESLFATVYDGTDCDPANEDHLQMRRDILRIVSIMHEARDSVNSLGVEPNRYVQLDAEEVRNLLYSAWSLPYPGTHEIAGYFSVAVCSGRPMLDPISQPLNAFYPSRFIFIRNDVEMNLIRDSLPTGKTIITYPVSYCMLNEQPPATVAGQPRDRVLDNSGARWNDPGGPGDRITVQVRYNHPLITPISREPYISMEARRTAVNESFRAPKAIRALQLPGYIGSDPDDIGELPETNTPTHTFTPTITETATSTPTATDVPPFSCDQLGVSWANTPFIGSEFYMSIRNDNASATQLYGLSLSWGDSSAAPIPTYPAMYLASGALDTIVHWIGERPASGFQYQAAYDRNSPGWLGGAYDYIASYDTSIWSGQFLNGPANLAAHLGLWDFDGIFRFTNPDRPGELCEIVLTRPDRPAATETPVPTAGPTPTPTPNCATVNDIQLLRGGWDTFDGTYYFDFVNSSSVVAEIIGFDFVWPDATHPQITYPHSPKYHLASVVLGEAVSAPDAQLLWTGPDSSGNTRTTEPFDRATRAGIWGGTEVTTEGDWLRVGIVPPNTTMRLHLNFDGTGVNDLRNFGIRDYHFHYPRLNIGCIESNNNNPGGGDGGDGGDGGTDPGGGEGDITLPIPSPTNTFTPRPTATQGPTATPSNTRPPATATNTRPPATATQVPPTQPPTLVPTRELNYTPPPTNKPGE